MRSIEEIIREANIDDFRVYYKWKDEVGWRYVEPRRLKWALESPEISPETKQLLIEEVDKEEQRLKEEKEYLLRLGKVEPKTHEIRVEGLTSALHYERRKDYWQWFFFGITMLVAFIVALLFCIFYSGTFSTNLWRSLALACACVTSVALTGAWMTLKGTKKEVCENEAQMMEDSSIGQAVRERFSCVEEQEVALLDFKDALIESGMRPLE